MAVSDEINELTLPTTTNEKIVDLLINAKKSIIMSTGFHNEFYNDKKIKTVMTDAIKRVKSTKIIITKDKESVQQEGWLFDLARDLSNNIQIRYNTDAPHWFIIDDKNIRLEKVHKIGNIGEYNFFDKDIPKDLVNVLKSQFEDWWSSAAE